MTKNIQKILAALCLALLLAGCTSLDSAGYTQMSSEKAAQLMEDYDDEIVLDVRTPEEYAEAHIPGAINVPNEEIGEEPIAELPDKDQIILVYCRSGNRSKEAAQKAGRSGLYECHRIWRHQRLARRDRGFIKQHRPTPGFWRGLVCILAEMVQ